jgi:putative hemolysin
MESMRPLAPLACALCLTACATHTPSWILPRDDGTAAAVSLSRQEADASIASVAAANDYCKERGRTAVFLKEQTEYQGVLTERGGGIARVAKNIPVVGDKLSSDEDFRVTARFKCVAQE